mmetsp:Transcript_34369/g.82814  ORF Transcript_34369/g.82814 Transcript_34369/m.82814 type:complete len:639 (+) Transcript_34369:2-1918(+)
MLCSSTYSFIHSYLTERNLTSLQYSTIQSIAQINTYNCKSTMADDNEEENNVDNNDNMDEADADDAADDNGDAADGDDNVDADDGDDAVDGDDNVDGDDADDADEADANGDGYGGDDDVVVAGDDDAGLGQGADAADQWYSSSTISAYWDSIQDNYNGTTVSNAISSTKTEVETMIDTDPSAWTTKQIVGLSVGVAALLIVSFVTLKCLYKCCRCCCCGGGSGTEDDDDGDKYGKRRAQKQRISRRRKDIHGGSSVGESMSVISMIDNSQKVGAIKDSSNNNDNKVDGDSNRVFKISTHPPHVIRKKVGGMFSMSRVKYDSVSSTSLPLGALLHGAHKLREKSMTGLGVKVAVIDSGIDKSHPGFHGQVKKQVWLREGTPLTEDDHGTHVAGTIHFMAPDASLYDYRVFGSTSKFGMDGDTAIARAIVQACEDGCQIINMSLRVSYPIVPVVKEAVEYAHSRNVIMVCAAGNDGDGQAMTNEMFAFPARWEETISVAAVGKKRGIPVARFSESNPQVDVAAIGVDVISFKPLSGGNSTDLFQSMQGTSMAAPHVSGLIAALMSHGKRYTHSQIKALLAQKYTVDIGPVGRDNSTGLGLATFLSSRSEVDALLAGKKPSGLSNSSPQKKNAEKDYEMMV